MKRQRHPRGLLILHEDRDLLVVDKAPGLLTMGTTNEKVQTAYHRLTNYVRKGNPKSRERIYIVHRLDREVSGILVFAKSAEAKNTLQAQWPRVQKRYLALVHGEPKEPAGTFSSYLVENGVHDVYSTRHHAEGKLSHTGYTVLGQSDGVTLLGIHLLTGRKHQIRVHLAENDLPILGDTRYGRKEKKKSRERRLGLHALSIEFDHPYSGEACFFETRVPHFFSGIPGTRSRRP